MQFPNCKFGEISQKIKCIKTIDELVKYSKEESKKVLAEVLEKCLQEEILQAIGTEERFKHKKGRSGYLNSGYKKRLVLIFFFPTIWRLSLLISTKN
jgi:transposase-like protein